MAYGNIKTLKKGNLLLVCTDSIASRKIDVTLLSVELKELCNEIAWDGDIQVVVLGYIEESRPSDEEDLIHAVSGCGFEGKGVPLSEAISKLDCPVVAAISGDAIGQGLELALACDIRIASETSRFGMSHIEYGVIPRDGGTQRLSRLVGRGKALEMILTGEVIDAQEALRIGLVHRIVPQKDVMGVTMKMAQEMASKAPIALRYTKETIHRGMDVTLEQGLRLEAGLYLLLHTTKDRVEGIHAFLEKRTPKFEGK